MHISRISVRNFRNFSELELSKLGRTVVVVGENGSGKSNLLWALRLVLDPSLPDTARQLIAEDFWDGLNEPFAGHEIRVEVELSDFDTDARAKALLRDCLIATQPQLARLTYLFRPKPLAGGQPLEPDYEHLIFGGTDETKRIRGEIWRYVALRVLPALRDAEGDLQNARSPLRRLLARAAVPAPTLTGAAQAIDRANETILAAPSIRAIDDAVRARLEEMVGAHFSVSTTLAFGFTDPSQMIRAVRLFINEAKRRSVDQTSLGTANLIYLALLLEQITQQESQQDTISTFLAVEEPEAHLHPHIQRVLFRDLLHGDRPLIVTTHSPHVASVAPLDSLVLLRSEGGASKGFTASDVGLTAMQKADVERYLDVSRAEILFARGVVLVEGIAEEYIVPAFASADGWNLDEFGVTVCSIAGTDFVPYQRLLGSTGLAIPYVAVTDGDPNDDGVPLGIARKRTLSRHRNAINAAVKVGDYDVARGILESENVFVGETTLELDLAVGHSPAMVSAFNDLVSGPIRRSRFDHALSDLDDDASRARILSEVERIGKGRYAQRLAPYLTAGGTAPPPYIAEALARIRELVGD